MKKSLGLFFFFGVTIGRKSKLPIVLTNFDTSSKLPACYLPSSYEWIALYKLVTLQTEVFRFPPKIQNISCTPKTANNVILLSTFRLPCGFLPPDYQLIIFSSKLKSFLKIA